jgi:hypothetical protein
LFVILKAYKANQKYYDLNIEELKKKYGGKILIICKEKVISISNNFEEYMRELESIDENDRFEAFIANVPMENVTYII